MCQLRSLIGPWFSTVVLSSNLSCCLVSDLEQLGRLGSLRHLDRLGRFGFLGKNFKYLSFIAQPMGLKDVSVLFGLKFTFWNGKSNEDPYQGLKNLPLWIHR